jgi:pyruvate, water dikinase
VAEGESMGTRDLAQTRELLTLFQIAEILERKDLTLLQILQGVVSELPNGFEYGEICRARITYRGETAEGQGFRPTSWNLRARIMVRGEASGALEVVYLENRASRGEPTFLLDERKLVETTAQKLGRCIETWERFHAPKSPLVPHPPSIPSFRKPEWRAILDLLAEIDPTLHGRLLRRLMNHLVKVGVPGIHEMIVQFSPAHTVQLEADTHGSNVPLPKRDMASMEKTFQAILRVAAVAVEEADLNALVRQWMRQDKLGFMALATERRNIPLVEITDIVDRFCMDTREGEPALSPADDLNVRVALSRRFLTENLRFIQIAKENMSIYDFGTLLTRVSGPSQGDGKLGGKAAGLILASHILKKRGLGNPLLESVRTPQTRYITSDGIYNFLRANSLEDLWSLKFTTIDEIRHNFPYLEQVIKHSFFTLEMHQQLQFILDDLGEGPLIVRSSSLLEDSEGAAFSGKYRSLFLPNLGSRKKRLDALSDAVAEVYASVFGPDPIQYRTERGLLDFMEEMGIIIQKVVGTRAGKYFFPAVAGVAFSNNEFRWSNRLRREDGILRIVAGMGTRAVDRVGDDFPLLVSPGQPDLRVNVTPDQMIRYAQSRIDLINLETGRFESPDIHTVLREVGDAFPLLEKLVSVHIEGSLRKPIRGMLDPERDDLVVTFQGLLEDGVFVRQMREMMRVLQETMGTPVDLEFAHDGQHLYLLQCRPQSRMGDDVRVNLPQKTPFEWKLFSANKFVTNASVVGVRYVVYVDPEAYSALPSQGDMAAVAEVVSRLNSILPRREFILMGPGRWGSRGDITLGVSVTYSGINNTQMLIEIARRKGNYVPDLSFGTHFFQDLVEARIRYLALYPDEEGNLFNETFFQGSVNCLAELLPEFAALAQVVRVIDIERVAPGCELNVLMDGEKDRALGFLLDRKSRTAF